MKFSILLPTRKRISNLKRMLKSIGETLSEENTLEVLFYVDADDVESVEFVNDLNSDRPDYLSKNKIDLKVFQDPDNDKKWIGCWWEFLYRKSSGDYIMLAGDDIIFKTKDWDKKIVDKYKSIGHNYAVVYCNDMSPMIDEVATLPFVSRCWCETVGYFVPTFFKVDFVDTWITDIARKCDSLHCLRDVVIEHIHWCWHKAPKDALYAEMRKRGDEFDHWRVFNSKESERVRDAEKINKKISESKFENSSEKKVIANRTIWIYWDDLSKVPEYVKICKETMEKNKGLFDIVVLSEKNIRDYIEIPSITKTFHHHCQRADYYRIKLLEKYGGIWIDYDTVILDDISFLSEKIDQGLFIQGLRKNNGFIGCLTGHEIIEKASYHVDNVISSVISGRLKLSELHDTLGWPIFLGVLNECPELKIKVFNFFEENIEFHYSNSIAFFSDKKSNIDPNFKLCSLYNSVMAEHFGKMSREHLLGSEMFLSKLYRRGLGYE